MAIEAVLPLFELNSLNFDEERDLEIVERGLCDADKEFNYQTISNGYNV
jgi:hypothetical protein